MPPMHRTSTLYGWRRPPALPAGGLDSRIAHCVPGKPMLSSGTTLAHTWGSSCRLSHKTVEDSIIDYHNTQQKGRQMAHFPKKSFPAEMPAGQHVCLLYGSERKRIAILKQYIKSALQMEEKVLYIGSDNPLVSRALLSPGDAQMQRCLKDGQLEVCDLARPDFRPEELPLFLKTATEKALAAGRSGLLFILDIRALLKRGSDPLAITRCEARLNEVCRSGHCRGLCQYNYLTLPTSLILHALATHPLMAIGGIALKNPFFLVPPPFLGQESPALVLDQLVTQIFENVDAMHF